MPSVINPGHADLRNEDSLGSGVEGLGRLGEIKFIVLRRRNRDMQKRAGRIRCRVEQRLMISNFIVVL